MFKPLKIFLQLSCFGIFLTFHCPLVLAQNLASLKADLAAKESRFGADHPQVAYSLNNLAAELHSLGKYSEAEALYRRCLTILQRSLGPTHQDVATGLNNLAELFRMQSRFAEAEPLYRQSLAIRQQRFVADHPDIAMSLNNIGLLYYDMGRYAEAEPLFKRALKIHEKMQGADHPETLRSLGNLAGLFERQGRYAEGEMLARRVLAAHEKSHGANHRNVALSLNTLGALLFHQGRYQEAIACLKRSLAIWERVFGPDHHEVASGLNNLARAYADSGQMAEAEPLYRRSLGIREKVFGADHPSVADTLDNLSLIYLAQDRYEEAESALKRGLAIREKRLGREHPDVADSLNGLAELLASRGRLSEARAALQRSLNIKLKTLGSRHPQLATVFNNLADIEHSLDRYPEAEALYQRSLKIAVASQGAEHPHVAGILGNLARVQEDQGRSAEALQYSRPAVRILHQRFSRQGGILETQRLEQKKHRRQFAFHVGLLSKLANAAAESFTAAQMAQASSVGQSVAQMAARFAAQSGELASLVRARQDSADRYASTDKALTEALGQLPDKRDEAAISSLRKRLADMEKTLADHSRKLSIRFPEYDALVSPEPVSLQTVQKLLHPGEALVFYLIAPRGSFAWVVLQDRADFQQLNISEKTLNEQVKHLRSLLDPQTNRRGTPYDAAAAHALYQKVFAPLEPALVGVKHVMVIPDGALQSLPFGVLVSQPPAAATKPAWLIDRYAFTTLPSVSALRALRTFQRASVGNEPFAGFGDPVLEGGSGEVRAPPLRAIFKSRSAGSGIADVNALRRAASLPETADELKKLAQTLGAPTGSLFLRQHATESQVKNAKLERYRVLAFATHGVMAGELSGIAEPGLVMTPPAQGSAFDDGYITASEIAQLKLNADWVLLSACNTAASDGAPGAEGLSGLAKSFFYAGARSLLVSHWYVDSNASVQITTEMLKHYAANPQAGKAEALRKSLLRLKTNPEYSHPIQWAPFVLVGEGGAL